MASLLPPYSKKHILIFGSVTLMLSFGLVYLLSLNLAPAKESKTSIVMADSQKLQEDFDQAFEELEKDNAHAALVVHNLFILDIRPEDEFKKAHITGAKNIHPADLKGALFAEDVNLVIYGKSAEDLEAARENLAEQKTATIQILSDDLSSLESQGYPITSQP